MEYREMCNVFSVKVWFPQLILIHKKARQIRFFARIRTEHLLSVQWNKVLDAGNTSFPDSSWNSYDVMPHVASLFLSSMSCSSRENFEVVAMLSITGHHGNLELGCVSSSLGISVYNKVDSKPLTSDPRKNIRVLPSAYVRNEMEVGAIVDRDDNCFRSSQTISLNSCHVFFPSFLNKNFAL